ncbi:hypothetical protein, partial [Sphingomonas sp.]|uniref:hypothetical protein n=1 Tax=Sphingomonas sp. TaxID=28214 RepID=UPI002899967B
MNGQRGAVAEDVGGGPAGRSSGRPLSFHLSSISPDRASRSLMIAPLPGDTAVGAGAGAALDGFGVDGGCGGGGTGI